MFKSKTQVDPSWQLLYLVKLNLGYCNSEFPELKKKKNSEAFGCKFTAQLLFSWDLFPKFPHSYLWCSPHWKGPPMNFVQLL